ncbi:MAG: hypothetical protein RL071_4337 [Pseudomonadota bacterium]
MRSAPPDAPELHPEDDAVDAARSGGSPSLDLRHRGRPRAAALLGLALWAGACGSGAKDSAPAGGGEGADGSDGGEGADGADGGDGADGSDGGDGVVDAVLGATCADERRLGRVELQAWGPGAPLSVAGSVSAAPHPWMAPAVLEGGGCGFHSFDAAACGPCPGGTLCGADGACAEVPRTHKDLRVEITHGDGSLQVEADPTTGQLAGSLPSGVGAAQLVLRWGEVTVRGPAMNVPDGLLADPTVRFAGDGMAPGAMTARWTARGDGTRVGTHIAINHHAAGPTYTSCLVDESTGGFDATAEMIDPLAVVTGLEFQGLDHLQVAAAEVEGGCVELRVWVRIFPG